MLRRLLMLIPAAIAFSAPSSSHAQNITSNLRGHWKLTETSGTTAVDSSPTPNNAAYTNGAVLASSTPVPSDGAVAPRFDGSNDYVAVPNESRYDYTGAMTVAVWIKVNAFTVAEQAIVTKGDTAWRVQRDATNNGVTFTCRGLTNNRVASPVNVNDGQWHHVVGVYTTISLQIYIDGRLSNSVSTLGFISTNNFPVEIGRNAEAAGKEFNGWLYDVRLYDRALSATDVSYLYTLGGPVGHWKLAESSGTTAADSSLYGANGVVSGGASWTTTCSGAAAFDFNGVDNYISVPNASQLQPTAALSIAAWIHGDAWGSGDDVDAIVRKGEGNPNNYQLCVANGRLSLSLNDNDPPVIQSNAVLSTGQWHHVAATWDGSTARLYVNGKLDKAVSHTGTIGADTRALYIGGRSGADLFDGMLYDVRLYRRALNQAEIAGLAGLIGHWRFAEGSGGTAADSSGLANNAALSGDAGWTTDCAGSNALRTNAAGAAQTSSTFAPPAMGTVAFWMQSNGNPSALGRVFGLGGDWEARQTTDGTVAFDLCGEAGLNFVTAEPLNGVGRWYHVVATFDSVTRAYAVYIDGQLSKSGVNSNAMAEQAAAVLSFGTRTGSTEHWQGALRDFRIYNRQLCSNEIAELYGLIGHWKLNETSGTSASDSSGGANGGALTGTQTWTRGAVDGAHQFDYRDGDDYISIVNSASLDDVQEQSYSLAAWFKPLSTPPGSGSANNANYGILMKRGYHIGLSYSNANTFQVAHYLTGDLWKGTETSPDTYPPAGRFYHVASVVDRPSGTITLYVDGVLKNTGYFSAGTAAREFGAEVWRLGIADPSSLSWGWGAHGVIDDARIYNRTLCPTEVETLYVGGRPSPGVRIIKWVEVR